jgi:glycolate oxidase iron-sulfur subunit
VKADELILAMRALMVRGKGLSLPKWLIFRIILKSSYLLPSLLRTGSLIQGLVFKRVPSESGLHLRFSLPYLDRNRWLPSIANPFFLNRLPEETEDKGKGKKIALFSGCSINYLFPSIGEATVRLLGRNGFSVILPKRQTCCGLPAYGSGEIETARSLARRNMEVFSKKESDSIMVSCDSCYYFLKEGYLKLFPEDEAVKAFSQKIVSPSIFFLNLMDRHIDSPIDPPIDLTKTGEQPRSQGLPWRLTYHDPCHLRRGMKIYQEPRRLLQSLPGIELVEMKQPNRCCGMAGSFNLVYYGLSQKILGHKLEDIEAAKTDGVVTGCMGCLMQLQDGLHQIKTKTKAVHFMEVLEKTWGFREQA